MILCCFKVVNIRREPILVPDPATGRPVGATLAFVRFQPQMAVAPDGPMTPAEGLEFEVPGLSDDAAEQLAVGENYVLHAQGLAAQPPSPCPDAAACPAAPDCASGPECQAGVTPPPATAATPPKRRRGNGHN